MVIFDVKLTNRFMLRIVEGENGLLSDLESVIYARLLEQAVEISVNSAVW
ncbi:hypothetical protein M9194_11885 [Vibrio sp. S4M6]|nr:hypothetical protein [Vibrio sinus]MCL9782127.1 hypothetical protein [Vibrio sinus]